MHIKYIAIFYNEVVVLLSTKSLLALQFISGLFDCFCSFDTGKQGVTQQQNITLSVS